jgi:hypothetical protein
MMMMIMMTMIMTGYKGTAYIVKRDELSVDEQLEYDDGYQTFHANIFVSDFIPVDRKITDIVEAEYVSILTILENNF